MNRPPDEELISGCSVRDGFVFRALDADKLPALRSLGALERLRLFGKNTLPDLGFLRSMKRIKTFAFSMDVGDGDISPCMDVPHAYPQRDRKHYNLKDAQLPKNLF